MKETKWRIKLDQARGEVLLSCWCGFFFGKKSVLEFSFKFCTGFENSSRVGGLLVPTFVLSCADCKEGRLREQPGSLGLLGSGAGEWRGVCREM